MPFTVTISQLKNFAPTVPNLDKVTDALNDTMTRYKITDSPRRVRYFVAQSFFESGGYLHWSENLNYTTPDRLVAVWPSRFTLNKTPASPFACASNYTCNPESLANLVYANRGGNGDVNSGDGYKYRGRGAFGLTFKNNYNAYSTKVYGNSSRMLNPDLVAELPDAFMSAGWFWDNNNLSALADQDAFTNVTKIINGSTSSVNDRLLVLKKVNSIFQW